MTAPNGDRFRRNKILPGYHPDEVDEFVGRIEATLAGTAPGAQPVTAADIRNVIFRVTRWGGYDETAVDDALDVYAEQVDRLAL
jgi:DivIVA domain-containing protein